MSPFHTKFDLIIVGAGPAGCTCAYMLRNENVRIAIIDKAKFPRDKICGDALSADVMNQLERINPLLHQNFLNHTIKKASYGVRFFSPNHEKLDVEFQIQNLKDEAPGFISKRLDFDNFYFNQIKEQENITVFENCDIQTIEVLAEGVKVDTTSETFEGKMIIAADGANSIVKRILSHEKIEKDHYCAGIRQYYENVSGFHDRNFIELHFYKDILPGYFWIFPLPNNQANVGIGMLSSEVSKKKINLKEKLIEIIQNHPNIKSRFSDAKPLESIKGFGLPIGSRKRELSGNRFLLLGDAASLIDPFTGEGIGNAIRSGRIAADHIVKSFEINRFDKKHNKQYDKVIYSKMWNELRISRSMQKLLKYPSLFNFVVKKANKNESVRILLSSMLDNIDLKKELVKLSFYFKLIRS